MKLDPPLARALVILVNDVADSGRTYGQVLAALWHAEPLQHMPRVIGRQEMVGYD